jgi:hypothetical protein
MHDVRGFQGLFKPETRVIASNDASGIRPLYWVVQDDAILCGYCDGLDLSDWIGAPVSEMMTHFSNRDHVFFQQDQLQGELAKALNETHGLAQVQALRNGLMTPKEQESRCFPEHFLIEAFRTWWKRVLPGEMGLHVRLTGEESASDFVVIFRKGEILSYCEPDLGSMGEERAAQLDETSKYLSEKFLVPIQSMEVSEELWGVWAKAEDPWKALAKSLQSKELSLAPAQWNVIALIYARAYLGV